MRRRHAIPLLAALACAAGLRAAEYRLQAATAWVDNLSRTSAAAFQRDAAVLSLDAAAVQARQFARDWTAVAALEAGREQVPDFRALDRTALGARASVRRKFGLGPLAPVLEAGFAVARHDFREEGRSAWRQEGGLALAKRLNESWRLAASATWDSVAARRAPFDTHGLRLAIDATWDVAERWRLAAGAARYDGQVVANAAGPVWAAALADGFGPRIGAYYRSTPWETTGTFGPGWVAYRVDADANFLWTEASFLLGDRTRAVLRLETVRVVNVVDVRYDTEIWSLALAHRF
jgi:hypothetical protein